MKLTPRQISAMLWSYASERKETFLIIGKMFGATELSEEKKVRVSEDIKQYDTSKIDSLTARHMDKLKQRVS